MSQYAKIFDVLIKEIFYDDFDNAPENVQRKVDELLEMIRQLNGFPRAMHVRQAFKDDLWMGNVTQKNQAWRMLFWIDDTTLILYRLLTHDERDKFLRI